MTLVYLMFLSFIKNKHNQEAGLKTDKYELSLLWYDPKRKIFSIY